MKIKKKKIVFVCTGNTCRSPMAEILLKRRLEFLHLEGYEVCSAGIAAKKGDVINPYSSATLAENGIEFTGFTSTLLTGKLLKEAFAVVCMTERQREYLMDMRWHAFQKSKKKPETEIENNVYSFAELTGEEVLDPYGKGMDCYRYVYSLLDGGMSALIEKLRLKENAAPLRENKKKQPATRRKTQKNSDAVGAESAESVQPPKKRGRPKKVKTEENP